MLLSFPTRSCRSCMVDLQRKTECAPWADEPSPYSSPSPTHSTVLRPSSPLFHRLVPFCHRSGWPPHTTRASLTCTVAHVTLHMSTSSFWWFRVCPVTHFGFDFDFDRKMLKSSGISISLHPPHPIHITHTIRINLPKTPNFQLNWAKMAHKKELVWRYLDQATWSLINAGHLEEEKWQWVCCTSHVISHWSLVRYLWQKTRIRRLYFNQRWDDATIERQQRGRIGGLEKPGGEDCGGGGGPVVMGFAKVLEGSPPCGKSSNPNPQFPGSLAL